MTPVVTSPDAVRSSHAPDLVGRRNELGAELVAVFLFLTRYDFVIVSPMVVDESGHHFEQPNLSRIDGIPEGANMDRHARQALAAFSKSSGNEPGLALAAPPAHEIAGLTAGNFGRATVRVVVRTAGATVRVRALPPGIKPAVVGKCAIPEGDRTDLGELILRLVAECQTAPSQGQKRPAR